MLWVGSDVRHVSRIAFLLVVSAGLGCGQSSYTASPGDLAGSHIPIERDVRSHPDSLHVVSIEVGKRKVHVSLDRDYDAIHQRWSCKSEPLSLSYATFWSRELLLAALESNYALSTLSKPRALRIYKERMERYKNALRIDVFDFDESVRVGPSVDVKLRVNGTAYEPIQYRDAPSRNAWLPGGQKEAYSRSTFYFPRSVDGEDVLNGARSVRLVIGTFEWCAWRWGESENSEEH